MKYERVGFEGEMSRLLTERHNHRGSCLYGRFDLETAEAISRLVFHLMPRELSDTLQTFDLVYRRVKEL